MTTSQDMQPGQRMYLKDKLYLSLEASVRTAAFIRAAGVSI